MGFSSLATLIDAPDVDHRAPPRPAWSTWDDETVARMRRLHAGWDAVAQALGRATPDVRRRYDPEWPKATRVAESVEATVADTPDALQLLLKRDGRKHQVLRLVNGRRDLRQIAGRLEISFAQASTYMTWLKADGLIDRQYMAAPVLTARGAVVLEALRG